MEYYIEKYGSIEGPGDYSELFEHKNRAWMEIKWEKEGRPIYTVKYAYNSRGNTYRDGDEDDLLSSYTATFFIEHLINKYSLNTYLKYCTEGISFEEAFGVEFDEELQAWKDEFYEENYEEFALE